MTGESLHHVNFHPMNFETVRSNLFTCVPLALKDDDAKEPCFKYFISLLLPRWLPKRFLFFYCMHPLRIFDIVLSLFPLHVHFRLYGSIHHIHLIST